MRFIIMHRTEPRWEAGASPEPELVARVGKLIGTMVESGVFLEGEGLRASSEGARLRGGTRIPGPFRTSECVPAGFVVLEVPSLDDAMAWASRLGAILDQGDIDVRPITEPWDIGMGTRPPDRTTRRFMALFKDPAAERGEPREPTRTAALRGLTEEMRKAGVLLGEASFRPSARGARLRRSPRGFAVTDGPFAEAKELIGGYCIVDVPSRDEAIGLALKYADVVGPEEVDVRELA